MISTNFASSITDPAVKQAMANAYFQCRNPTGVDRRGIAYAIEQPADVDVGSIVIRPTASRLNGLVSDARRPWSITSLVPRTARFGPGACSRRHWRAIVDVGLVIIGRCTP